MSITVANSSSSWVSSLTLTFLKADLSADVADGTLSYSDLLGLLTDLENKGPITASEVGDLKTIAANLNNGVSTSDYLASIFSQLVDGSPANANWNGGSVIPSALGNLAAGTTPTQLSELIGKWFLGTDLPDPTTDQGTVLTYQAFTLPLYGVTNAPVTSDVAQGALGDCVVCAVMTEMANAAPGTIQSNIVSVGNGVYGIRFYINGVETWVTVNSQLPVSAGGSLVYMNGYTNLNPPLWADIMEKAYAQLSSTGQIGHPAVNSYENIDSNNANTVTYALTGANIAKYSYNDTNWSYYKAAIVAAVTAGEVVNFSCETDTTGANGKTQLVSDHEFALIGYDQATGNFIVRNPWGDEGASWQYWTTQFEASMDDLYAAETTVTVANTVSTPVHIVTAQGPCYSQSGWYWSRLSNGSSFAEFVGSGASVPISSLFETIDTAGAPIVEYLVQDAGPGSIQLNGATNLATADQQAQGNVLVSAADLSKLTYSSPASTGYCDLLVSAYDGAAWSVPTDVAVDIVNDAVAAITPAIGAVVAPSGTIAVASLFNVVNSAACTYYQFTLDNGGQINLNGATSWGSSGYVDINASDLSKLTYTAPSTPGMGTLEVSVCVGGMWSYTQYVQLLVGESVAQAIQDDDNGQLVSAAAVADYAANIFANLDGLQTMLSAGVLKAVTFTDTRTVRENVTPLQRSNDAGVLALLSPSNSLILSTTALDFDGTGRSDILWQNTNGQAAIWTMNGLTQTGGSPVGGDPGANWHVVASADINTDGYADIVWQNTDNGQVVVWTMSGFNQLGSDFVGGAPGSDWHVVGTGDFAGNGQADLLWQNTNGQAVIWTMNGTAQTGSSFVGGNPGSDWKIVGTGDFNGDGKSDIVWQDTANGQVVIWTMNGTTQMDSAFIGGAPGADWHVKGIGDFAGNGQADLLWQNDNGQAVIWTMNGLTQTGSTFVGGNPGTSWHIVGTGDYNGDGCADILWQNDNGQVAVWTMNGTTQLGGSPIGGNPGTSWHIPTGVG